MKLAEERALASTLVVLLLGCASPSPAPAGADFAATRRWLEGLGTGEEFQDFRITETSSPYLQRFRELSREQRELREFEFHGRCNPGHPKTMGALQIDRIFLAAAGDAEPTDEGDFEALVALAQRQRLALASIDDVRWFLHAESGLPPIDVMPTHVPRSFAFRIQTSGVPGPWDWNSIQLDDDGVPQRITWKRGARQP